MQLQRLHQLLPVPTFLETKGANICMHTNMFHALSTHMCFYLRLLRVNVARTGLSWCCKGEVGTSKPSADVIAPAVEKGATQTSMFHGALGSQFLRRTRMVHGAH